MSGVRGMRRGQGLPDDELEPCGTLAAYRRHLRRGDPVDRDCRQAVTRAWQDRVAAGYVRPSRGNRKAVHLAGLRGAAMCGCGRRTVSDVLDEVTCRNCLRIYRRRAALAGGGPVQPDDMPPPSGDPLRAELAAKGYALGGVIGLAPVPGSACDAGPGASIYQMPDGSTACRCVVCCRCGHHTGNSHQGHYWKACKVLAERLRAELKPGETLSFQEWLRRTSRENWHFCCGNEFGCELETEAGDA